MNGHPYAAFMNEAIALAGKGRWHAAPNPMVGAVLVQDGRVAARGWHSAFGREHAEIACLREAEKNGIDPAACTLVVTLEPCCHQGKTPPCTDAILAAGIKRVIIGMADVNAEAAGGAERLRAAGLQVEMGILEDSCRDLAADFLVWQTTERPYVILKMAATLDGRIAARSGSVRRVTGDASRSMVRDRREGVGRAGGAVLVGGNTFAQDDPLLTARTPAPPRQPLAAVVMSRLPGMDAPFQLIRNRPEECVFFSSVAQAASPNAQALRRKGARVYGLDRAASGRGLDAGQMLVQLRQTEQCLYVLCEGGGRLALSLLDRGLVDEFHLHLAPLVLGDAEACPLFSGRDADSITDAIRLRLDRVEVVEGDTHLYFRPARKP